MNLANVIPLCVNPHEEQAKNEIKLSLSMSEAYIRQKIEFVYPKEKKIWI